ncbi:MAG: hypothetical protein ACLP0A_11280 [Verrucomicrobiia bacterium]
MLKLVFLFCKTTDIETFVFFIFEFQVAKCRITRLLSYTVVTMPVPLHTTGNDTTTVLGAGRARRGRRWLMKERLNTFVADWHKLKTCGRNQQQRLRREGKFELCQWLGKFRSLLGFLRARNDFAKGARMSAVKRSRDGISKGGSAEVFGEHPRPCHGLQRTPVRAGSSQQHENQQSVANPIHHR